MRCPGATLVAAALVLTVVSPTGQAGTAPPGVPGRIDSLVGRYFEFGLFNGSVLVAGRDGVVVEKGYGMANFEWRIPNTPDTRFRLGSLTKQFTAVLILQLAAEGKLSLDDKLSVLLPYYRRETGSRVSIHQLLSHTSGIPDYTGNPALRARSRLPLAVRDLVTTYCSGDLEFEPGSRFAYSNSGYVILGAMIEQVTGKSYEQVLKERILDPAGLLATGYDFSERLIDRRAAGYENRLDGLRNADFVDMSLPYAAGALYSTVRDLYLWDQALYGTKLLSGASREKLFEPGLGGYGYGWFVRQAPVGPGKSVRTVLQHGGNINGFSGLMMRVPEDRTVIVLLNNTGGAPLIQIGQGIGDILYGREPQPPTRPLARVLQETLREKGIDAAIAQFREIKAANAPGCDLGQGQLNQLGYQLLQSGRAGDAIAIFKLNAEAFPEWWNAYDSLGEAYAAKGEKKLAIKSYARSIELNPANANGIRKLQELISRAAPPDK